MAPEHQMVETNGVRLHCAVTGRGPLVLLLHGFPECWYSWRHQIAALAPHFRVVAPDLRGYNESEKPEGVAAYALAELVADVHGLVRAFGEEQAVIVGHDWGGIVACAFATAHPEATRKLVVMNGPHPAAWQRAILGSPLQLAKSWYLFFFQIPWLPEFLLGLGGAWPVGNALRQSAVRREAIPDEDVARLREAASRPGALRSAIHYYRALFRSRRSLGDWPKISSPTLVVWAERDVALRVELARDMQAHFSGPYEIRYVADSGHWVQQEQPELVNRILLEFLADLLPAHESGWPAKLRSDRATEERACPTPTSAS